MSSFEGLKWVVVAVRSESNMSVVNGQIRRQPAPTSPTALCALFCNFDILPSTPNYTPKTTALICSSLAIQRTAFQSPPNSLTTQTTRLPLSFTRRTATKSSIPATFTRQKLFDLNPTCLHNSSLHPTIFFRAPLHTAHPIPPSEPPHIHSIMSTATESPAP